jgi:hypothetical protein
MGKIDLTGPQETKKAAPCGATLFKEAMWQVSVEEQGGAVSGEETAGESREHWVKLFQRLRPLRLPLRGAFAEPKQ